MRAAGQPSLTVWARRTLGITFGVNAHIITSKRFVASMELEAECSQKVYKRRKYVDRRSYFAEHTARTVKLAPSRVLSKDAGFCKYLTVCTGS